MIILHAAENWLTRPATVDSTPDPHAKHNAGSGALYSASGELYSAPPPTPGHRYQSKVKSNAASRFLQSTDIIFSCKAVPPRPITNVVVKWFMKRMDPYPLS